MTRSLSATGNGGRATFLLEVALDRARIKQRFAKLLYDERVRRGGGDARRFPQPEMAQLLGIGMRQYQRWEDPDDGSLPYWRNIEAIGEKLDVDVSDLFNAVQQLEPEESPEPADLASLRRELATEIGRLRDVTDQLEERLAELAPPQQARGQRGR